jgi:AcrR family transcriptional regulator
MGLKERRAREKARVRSEILNAALAIADAKGWDAVTIRAIAGRIEFSPAAIYEHFPAKTCILSEVALRGLRGLAERLEVNGQRPANDRLQQLAETIWSWAFENRMLFQLIHTGGIFEFGTAATPQEARAVFTFAREAIAVSTPVSRKNELDDLTDLLWASLSGLILLTMFGRVAGGEARAVRLRDRLTAGLKLAWG